MGVELRHYCRGGERCKVELWEAGADTTTTVWGIFGDVDGLFGVICTLRISKKFLPEYEKAVLPSETLEKTHQRYEYAAPQSPWPQHPKPAA